MPLWLAYLLGFVSWIPLGVIAVLTGRLLAAAHAAQTRAAASKDAVGGRDPVRRFAAAARRPEIFDDWSFAWDDLR